MNNSLDAGAVDAAMDDQPVVQFAINQGKHYAIHIAGESVGSFGFAVKKDGKHEDLVEDFNKALAEMKKDGTYDAIMAKWLGDEKADDTKKSTASASSSKNSQRWSGPGEQSSSARPSVRDSSAPSSQ